MSGLSIVPCSGCEAVFMGEPGLCPACEAKAEAERDPLKCRECKTTLLAPVATGLCGICDPAWREHLDVAA